MRIARVVYDPPGSDTENGETVTLANHGSRAQLRGFALRDEAGARFRLPAYRIRRNDRVLIHSGKRLGPARAPVRGVGYTWNDSGDTARLLAPGGRVVDTCSWGDGRGTAAC